MADFVVGMAKSVLDGALTKAQAALEEEGKLRQSAAGNLVFITGEFDMMKCFLEVASNKHLENSLVRTWVRQISDLAYDVEDCIEFVVHLDKRNRWWFRMLKPVASCLALPPMPLDVAVEELERLKAMVADVSSRNSRYSLIGDTAGSAQNDQQQPSSSSDAVAGAAFQTAFKTTQKEKGRQCNLTEMLNKEDRDLGVISMWDTRPGGGEVLGMVSIAWNSYTNKETCKKFVCRAWVKLMHPFNLHEFVQSLTGQFYANKEEQATHLGVQDLRRKMGATGVGDSLEEFERLVMKNRYLVVLEDLSTMADWDAIRRFFPDMKNGSRIILSTQNFEVASLAVGHPCQVSHLGELSADHSLCALFTKVSEYDAYNSTKANNAPASKNGVPVITSKKEEANNWIDTNCLVGRESEMKDLCQTVNSARRKSYQVMSVWGIAGVGKSALVKKMFCERIIMGKLFIEYGWVDVSNPFNLWEFSRALLSNLRSPKLDDHDPAGLHMIGSTDTIVECRKVLEKYACLVVIDGLQSTEDWDLIKDNLVSGSNKHTIVIVITNEREIATHCRGDKGHELVFNVKGLDADTALELFTKVAKDSEAKVIHEYNSRCGGLPRVIVGIAGSLAENTTGQKHALSINNKFMREVETNGEFASLSGLFVWMDSYLSKCFRNFPDSLKPCILYLPIFPRNYVIRRRRLIRRWIAEGYSRDSHEVSAEMTGEQLFSDLLNLSIVQQPSAFGLVDTRIPFCQVNGFFREYIVSRPMEDNLVFELSGRCDLTTKRTGRHLVISKNWVRDKVVFESIDFSRLRSLTVFGNWESFILSESMKLLRVLDLEGALKVEYSDLEKMFKLMSRLKFLSLRGCNDICHLPSSVGNMRQLQTLDVRHTSIVSLPVNITKLENLQYIRAGTTSPTKIAPSPHNLVSQLSIYCSGRHRIGVQVPAGIGKLTALHTLGVVNVSASGTKAFIEELKNLTHLRKLGVSGIRKKNSNKFILAISDLVHLGSLSVRLENNNESCLDGILLPLVKLRSLKLYGLGNRLPNWSGQLTMLTKMDLEIAKITEEDYVFPPSQGARVTKEGKKEPTKGVIKILSKLLGLCILRLRVHHLQDNVLDVSVITNDLEEESFQKIKIFEIGCSSSSKVTFGKNTMKNLEQLKVDCGIWSQVFGVKHLGKLEEVLIKGSSRCDQALVDHLKEELKNHPKPKKPVVKLEDLPSPSWRKI